MSHGFVRSAKLVSWLIVVVVGIAHSRLAEARSSRPIKRLTAPASEAVAPPPALSEMGQIAPPDVTNDPQLLDHPEMISLVKKYAREISSALMEGERHREEAVHRKDAIKLACIQDRLSSMKLVKKVSDDRLAATERPIIRDDALHLRHEFRTVEMARERISQLHRELVECVGQSLEISLAGQTEENNTGSDTTDPSDVSVQIPAVDRPSPASTFK